ncbi:GGDEF domain-containing protein [Actinoplanes sp. NPDC051475]|uniref:GGDEF domain-containing protein n=1 Tax=Actinoplanes sp. NPDC051475 TaxID=3157225 RepID=UPI00344D8233
MAEKAPRRAVTARVAACLGAGWLLLYAVLVGVAHGSPALERFVTDGLYLVPIVSSAVLSVVAARRLRGRGARMWGLLAASYAAQLVGELIWSGNSYFGDGQLPPPSAADAFYLIASALAVPAILVGFGGAGLLRQLRGLLDALLIMLGAGALGWTFLISPRLTGSPDAAVLVSAAYPLLDLVLLTCLVVVGFAGHRGLPRSTALVGWSVGAIVLSDIGYNYLVVIRGYEVYHWLTVGWQAGTVLASLAGLTAMRSRESDARPQALDRNLTLLPAWFAALATFTCLVVDKVRTDSVGLPALVTTGGMVLAVLVRQYLFAADRTRLARQLQAAVAEQQRLAVTDGLTGLHNRRHLTEMLTVEADRAGRTGSPLSVVVIDLDHFKQINDTYGHQAGDAVLVEAASRIRGAIRATDVLARYGGEEFVVLLPGTGGPEAMEISERIRTVLAAGPIPLPRHDSITVTASLGAAVSHWGSGTGPGDALDLVAEADRALYKAKSAGRNLTVLAAQVPVVH